MHDVFAVYVREIPNEAANHIQGDVLMGQL